MPTAKRHISIYILSAVVILFGSLLFPVVVSAAETDGTGTNTATETGPNAPTGEVPYTYNEETGMWENDKYAWDPVTKQTKPLYETDYSYNPETGHWDTTEWVYSPESGTYEENVKTTKTAPKQTSDSDSQTAAQQPANTAEQQSNAVQTTNSDDNNESTDEEGVKNTSTEGGNDIDASSDTEGTFDSFYNASISGELNSSAVSGDAEVSGNTTAGDATTGDATAIANLINSIASYWGGLDGDLMTFISDIYNDVLGDIVIDPSQLDEALNNKITAEKNTDITVNVDQSGNIENDVNLNAASGDATVDSNTEAGDATTGDATTIANVINMINSAIASGTSFMGSVNIHGSLDGDILFPPGVLETLLSNNAPDSDFDASLISNKELLADIDTSSSISNDVNLNAASGDAIVDSNTRAGDAATGDAETNLTILNLTNHHVVGSNALLVFVNVLGEWVGLIMDAPEGTTAAAIGGGISDNNIANDDKNTTLDVDIESDHAIRNNINLNSTSGNAAVTNNTSAGNATTGNASASANIANIINTGFSLDDWFGVLFVNVFGSWFGSFGVDTMAGTLPEAPVPESSNSNNQAVKEVKVFRFNPKTTKAGENYELVPANTTIAFTDSSNSGESHTSEKKDTKAVLDEALQAVSNQTAVSDTTEEIRRAEPDFMWPVVGGLTAAALLGTERWLARRENK